MREIRSSGSVEGVMGNRDSYSDSRASPPHSQIRDNLQSKIMEIQHKRIFTLISCPT